MMTTAKTPSQKQAWGQIIARSWIDAEFKKRFMLTPREVLAEYGIELPGDIQLNVVEDTANVHHFILPAPPTDELVEEELVEKNAAYCYSGHCGRCGCGCGICARCYC